MKLAVIYVILIFMVIFVLARVFKVIKEGDAVMEDIMEKKKDEEIVKYLCGFLKAENRAKRINDLETGGTPSRLFINSKEELNALYNIDEVKKIYEDSIQELATKLDA